MSSTARFSVSFAACRTMRKSRSEMLANGTMRMRIRFACSPRVSRACADSAISLSPSAFSRFCWTVETSLTLSAIIRVISWKRVKRSNSSGSKVLS